MILFQGAGTYQSGLPIRMVPYDQRLSRLLQRLRAKGHEVYYIRERPLGRFGNWPATYPSFYRFWSLSRSLR